MEESKSKKPDLIVMAEMAEKDLDIRLCINLRSVERLKKGGKIVMEVDETTVNVIMDSIGKGEDTHMVALYIINKPQFLKIQNEEVNHGGE